MMKRIVICLMMLVVLIAATSAGALAKTYKFAWSHYTGWEPWAYAQDAGILDKWAKKYGIEIELSAPMDYIESINLFTAGEYDACVMTNMDALTIPAVGGVDTTALIVGDFSNGNDAIVAIGADSVKGLKGQSCLLVELSVSDYLLSRALDQNGMTSRDIQMINTSDADIASVFTSNPSGFVVTWNPLLMQVMNVPGANLLYDSSQIPGEIIDLTVVRSDAPEALKKALVGAWYETMAVMSGRGPQAKEALAFMAKTAGGTPCGIQGAVENNGHVLTALKMPWNSPTARS